MGRPVSRTLPDPIPDTPENVAQAILFAPPKKDDEWRYTHSHRVQTTTVNEEGDLRSLIESVTVQG